MKLSGPFVFISIFLLISQSLLNGCSDPADKNTTHESISESGPVLGGVYRIPLRSNPTTLDPAYLQDIYGIALVHQIFDGLVRFDPSLTIQPALAETWQVKEEGKTYRFVLRDAAFFHNREPVTSEDVIFSIGRLLRAEPAPAVLPHLLKITGASEYRAGKRQTVYGLTIETAKIFTVRLDTPHVPFLTALGMYQASIVPKQEVLRLGKDLENNQLEPVRLNLSLGRRAVWSDLSDLMIISVNPPI